MRYIIMKKNKKKIKYLVMVLNLNKLHYYNFLESFIIIKFSIYIQNKVFIK